MQFFPSFSVFLKIGSLEIHYYALCIITGALIAYELGQYRFKKLGYARNILSDYFFALLLLGIIGARIWYVIFMWNELYAANPMEIFAVWHGGLAIQGGIFAGLIYSAYFFKKHEIPFLVAGDAIMPGVLIAQALGRWGNFFNHEAYGSAVSLQLIVKAEWSQSLPQAECQQASLSAKRERHSTSYQPVSLALSQRFLGQVHKFHL